MSPIHRVNRIFSLLALVVYIPALCISISAAAAEAQTQPAAPIVTIKIKVDDLNMIIVPVSINGSGPYDFLLDNGASKTLLDRKLADQLSLPRLGEHTIVGALASTQMSIVHINSLAVAGAAIGGGEMLSSDHPTTVTSRVRGVLGEDFLRNFDLLIDYKRQTIQLQSPLGSMSESAIGQRLPLELTGIYHGKPTGNRLVVTAHIPELGNAPMSLLLDSGANGLTLFRVDFAPGTAQQATMQAGSFNQWVSASAATRTVRSLALGSSSLSDLTAVALARQDVDTDGLIPTSLFHSIFISARGKFAILNPSFPKPNNNPQSQPQIAQK